MIFNDWTLLCSANYAIIWMWKSVNLSIICHRSREIDEWKYSVWVKDCLSDRELDSIAEIISIFKEKNRQEQ